MRTARGLSAGPLCGILQKEGVPMKKQWLSIMAVVLTAMAASPKVFPVVANPASGMLIGGGKPQTEANSPKAPTEEEWVIEAVDLRKAKEFNLGSDRGLRVDAAGNPHIAYGGASLYYAWYDGVDWHYETADNSVKVGYYASLALDEDGNPHIAYLDSSNDDIKYAYRDGSGWHTEIVDPGGGNYTSLALDEGGYGHIGYGSRQGGLAYAYQDDTGWYTRTVDSQITGLGYWDGLNSLALDKDGYPHIGYYVEFIDVVIQQNLRYAYQDVTGWYTQTVDSSGRVGNHPSLALDSAGRPHISYRDIDHQDLKYAYLDATGWYSVTVDSSTTVCYFTSLDLDNQDHPHIVYNSDSSEILKYANFNGSDWDIQTVPIEGNPACAPSSIGIADNGDVHLVYEDWWNGRLRYAYYDEIDWQTALVDSEIDNTETGTYSSLALDQDGYPHIGYYNAKYGSPKHKYKTSPGTWVSDSPNYSGADVGRYTSLAIDGYGYVHVSAYCAHDSILNDLVYAYQDASGWNEMILITSNVNDGLYTSLDVTGDGEAYISYYDARFGDLYYAMIYHAYYYTDKLDSTGDVGKYTSLTLDASGNFHISYYDSTNGNLKYLEAGQTKQVVDSVGDVELYSSIDTDGSENPHISYSGNGLLYAYYDGSEWYTETVDTVGQFSSIAIDDYGCPHISYYDEVNGDLKYAYKEGGTWYLQVVDDYGDVGQYTSIDLDKNGNPHISYYDVTNKGLKYAYYSVEYFIYLPLVLRE
jgi:hypothetical protein